MKVSILLMITALLQVSFTATSQTVTYSGNKVSLHDIFTVIKTQTGVVFFYDAGLLEDAKPVTVSWKNVSLRIALDEIFKEQSLDWVLEEQTVTVIRHATVIAETSPNRSPSVLVQGRVSNAEGDPLSSVTVMIKGTRRGTTSNEDGRFSITAEEKNVLQFSAVNYITKEMKVQKADMSVKLLLDIKPIEAFVVGGNFKAFKRKAIATSVTVLDSKKLERIPSITLDQIFRGWVPGTNTLNIGDQAEGFPTLVVRGAGADAFAIIAVYIDGVEFAGGSGYLSQLDKTNIDRIEIVRGPGAGTMYGTGSNGGIIQIFTKKPRLGESSVSFTTSAGFYKSKWVKENPFQQMHNIETNTSFKNVALRLGGAYRTVNAYLPDGGEKNKGFYGSANFNHGKLQVNFSTRYNVRNYHISRDPYYDTAVNPRKDIIIEHFGQPGPAYELLFVYPTSSQHRDGITENYLVGTNVTHTTLKNWVNKIDAGFTMSSNAKVPAGVNPLQRQYSKNKKQIITLRYSNTLNLSDSATGLAFDITSGVEYKKYSAIEVITRPTTAFTIGGPDNNNYGAFVQVNPSYKNVFLTLGMRYEKNELFIGTWNPRLGLTSNFKLLSLTIKPRIAWGKGIQAPQYEERFGRTFANGDFIYSNPGLKPQSQQGFDYGVEVYSKSGDFRFEAVYYNNHLDNIIREQSLGRLPGDSNINTYMYKNIYRLVNNGWEFSGEYHTGRFSLNGTFSLMNTAIGDTSGFYQYPAVANAVPGTKLTEYARHVGGLNMTYQFHKIFRSMDKGMISLNISESLRLNTFDAKKYALDVAYGRFPYSPGVYPPPVARLLAVRVGVYAEYHVTSDWKIFVQGSNILNDYTYELSSDFLTHGATWLFGIKYNYSKK